MWDRCWALARIHLGLSDEAFFRLTPRQLDLLLAQHRARTDHQELLAGIVASTIANHSFCPPKKPLAPGDFMPSQWAKREARQAERPKRSNRKAIANNVRCFLMARVEKQEP